MLSQCVCTLRDWYATSLQLPMSRAWCELTWVGVAMHDANMTAPSMLAGLSVFGSDNMEMTDSSIFSTHCTGLHLSTAFS